MQLDLFFGPRLSPTRLGETLRVGDRLVPVEYVRHDRARRYVLRLRPDGTARVTVPRRGSLRDARVFAQSQTGWLARQLARRVAQPPPDRRWMAGTTILFRGVKVVLLVELDGGRARVRLADQVVEAPATATDLRAAVEAHLRRLAVATLPPRVFELAARHQLPVRRVSVRDQRSRWGSCSRKGTVSLNWRLVQMPDDIRDYVIWHELMHLREMNHSPRYWREVAAICPEFQTARRWLREHRDALR